MTDERFGMGWVPEIPSHRDHSVRDTESVRDFLKAGKVLKANGLKLPRKLSLRKCCSPVKDQGPVGACVAFSVVELCEMFIRKVHGKSFTGSPLFEYKAGRDQLGWKGDTGLFNRTGMQVAALFGITTEKAWPYKPANLDVDPPTRSWMIAQSFQAVEYYRLDDAATSPQQLHERILANLSAELPSIFGWPVYPSIEQAATTGDVPFPADDESPEGGHSTPFIGWDLDRVITNKRNGKKTVGAYECLNHWSKRWGDNGFFWLPFEYTLRGLIADVWSLSSQEFIDLGVFN